MDNTIYEGNLAAKHWEYACFSAEIRIRSNVARRYGLRLMMEDFRPYYEKDIPDDVLARALEHTRQTFDVNAVHIECRKFLLKKEKEVQNLSARTARLPSGHSRAWKRKDSKHVLSHHRYQLPVGQGGFNVGTIRNLGLDEAVWRSSLVDDAIPTADFMYVYDCGSIPIAVVSRRWWKFEGGVISG